jgi:plasmid stabilization system protein ParE
MDKYKIIVLPKAKNDIENILIYLLNENVWKKLVYKIKNLIYSSIFWLEYFPQKCSVYIEEYRRLLVKSYSIFYKIDEKK